MSVYDFSRYEDYFADILHSHHSDRGYKTKLAKAIHVHPSYITRISSGTAALTPDQAASLAEFWGLNIYETEYFIWLVLQGRSGNPSLKTYSEKKLRTLKKDHDELGNSLPAEKVDQAQNNEYYLSWIYSAIHMLLTLPKEHTAEQIAQRLCIPEATTKTAIAHLIQMGLVESSRSGRLKSTKKNIHLSNQSWMAKLQHSNWRMVAVERIGRPGVEDVNYTGVHSISKKDLEKLRRQIREFLIEVDRTIRPSLEETICVMCLDLLEL